jgi:molybdopterin-containing oxidoreductase family iron-sulfur binding subunit
MDQRAGLAELVGEMNAGTVSLLLMLGGNPVYTVPSDLKFAEAMDKVPLRANLSQFPRRDGGALSLAYSRDAFPRDVERCARARRDGHNRTAVDFPALHGHSVHEVVSTLSAARVRSGYDIVRSYWGGQRGAAPAPAAQEPAVGSLAPLPGSTALSLFDKEWRRWLHDGVIPDTAFATKVVALQGGAVGSAPAAVPAGLEVVFRPDPQRVRRTLRQQRLASGIAEVAHQADVGQTPRCCRPVLLID